MLISIAIQASNLKLVKSLFSQNNNMELKVAAKCIVNQDTGLVVYEAGNKLQVRAVIMCKMTPFIITEDGDINYLASD